MNKSSHHHRLFKKKHSKNNTQHDTGAWVRCGIYGRRVTLRSSALSLQAIRVGGSKEGASWSRSAWGFLVSLFWGEKKIGQFVESRTAGLVEETDWFMKYIDIYMCVCVLTMRYVKVSFCCITLAPLPTSVTYHKIDMYLDGKLLPRCKINITRISTCLASFLGEGASLDIYIYIYRQRRSLECSSQFNESQDIHMQNVNPWTIVPRRVTTSWEPYTHESYNLK